MSYTSDNYDNRWLECFRDSLVLDTTRLLTTILVKLVGVTFKTMTAERGTYNYLVAEDKVIDLLCNKVGIEHNKLVDTPFCVDLYRLKDLDMLTKYLNQESKELADLFSCNIVLEVLGVKVCVTTAYDLFVLANLIAYAMYLDAMWLDGLRLKSTRLKKYLLKAKMVWEDVETSVDTSGQGVCFKTKVMRYVTVFMCRSFDDNAKIYCTRLVLWENDKYLYVYGYPIILK